MCVVGVGVCALRLQTALDRAIEEKKTEVVKYLESVHAGWTGPSTASAGQVGDQAEFAFFRVVRAACDLVVDSCVLGLARSSVLF